MSSILLQYPKTLKLTRIGTLKGKTLSDLISVAKHNKVEGGPVEVIKNFSKKSQNAEKTERGALWDFSTPILSQNVKKFGRGPLVKKNGKKVPQCRKYWKWGPFSLARYCMLRGKQEKPFWFSSLGQMVQFDTIKFRRTLKNFFGQSVWIEKKKPLV